MDVNEKKIESDLRSFFSEKLVLKREEYSLDDPLRVVLDLDSLNLMLITFHLESTYHIRLEREEIERTPFKTLRELTAFVLSRSPQGQNT